MAVARRTAGEVTRRLGLSDDVVARAELVAVELANNILQHAGAGQLILSSTPTGDAVQMIALDKGPGIGNIPTAERDGVSTSTTLGIGLGAVRRLAQQLDIYSEPARNATPGAQPGTIVSVILREIPPPRAFAPAVPAIPAPKLSYEAAVVSIPISSETVNGDSWAIASSPDRDLYLMVDGLGHGYYAAEAANLAVNVFGKLFPPPSSTMMGSRWLSPGEAINRLHAAMRATRGAAVAIAAVEHASRTLTYCGIGNIVGSLQHPDSSSQSLASHNGTVGHQMRSVQEFTYRFQPGSHLVLHSDGLTTHWKFANHPGLAEQHPATIAATIYRQALRGRDDASVLVSKLQ